MLRLTVSFPLADRNRHFTPVMSKCRWSQATPAPLAKHSAEKLAFGKAPIATAFSWTRLKWAGAGRGHQPPRTFGQPSDRRHDAGVMAAASGTAGRNQSTRCASEPVVPAPQGRGPQSRSEDRTDGFVLRRLHGTERHHVVGAERGLFEHDHDEQRHRPSVRYESPSSCSTAAARPRAARKRRKEQFVRRDSSSLLVQQPSGAWLRPLRQADYSRIPAPSHITFFPRSLSRDG